MIAVLLAILSVPTAGEMLAACLSGPDRRVSPDECIFRYSCGDTDVDLEDFAWFQTIAVDLSMPWEFLPECCQ